MEPEKEKDAGGSAGDSPDHDAHHDESRRNEFDEEAVEAIGSMNPAEMAGWTSP